MGQFQDEEQNTSFSKHIADTPNEIRREILLKNYISVQNQYNIKELFYIPRITLVSSCYGVLHGVNKFWERTFVPHIEPIWKNKFKKLNEGFVAYAYPFETEGILFQLDFIKICEWLNENNFLSDLPVDEDHAKRLLINLEEEHVEKLNTLLHTFSHILIRRSSVYTGLDSDSCGELIFPRAAAIFIYSTSNINTGGFQYIFENEINNWFADIHYELRECTFDPACLTESGACFACLYLPEYVCSYFNKSLDRDVLLGRYRTTGFWK